MNRQEALDLLNSNSPHERFKAAHALNKVAVYDDLRVLKQAKHSETDLYVIKRLEVAISGIEQFFEKVEPHSNQDNNEGYDEKLFEHAKAQAIEWISGLLLHEVGAKLGLASYEASNEITNYENSKTKHHIDNLLNIFDAIESLRRATNTFKAEEFDLAELIDNVINVENSSKSVEFMVVGIRPLIINGHKNLINLALCNGIRNAIDAILSLSGPLINNISPIVVTWGETESDYWIAVLDDGIGISSSINQLFEIGKSTKKGHTGFGLAIAKQALETLGGYVTLEPQEERGVKYEMRWEKKS
ncbi:sensor histidine kinase [Acinetobacter pittii]|uniref:sensor histidine kinase n=1 Tax=Acinetobacter pittii TaxID=48296 RepID=UPI003B42F83A